MASRRESAPFSAGSAPGYGGAGGGMLVDDAVDAAFASPGPRGWGHPGAVAGVLLIGVPPRQRALFLACGGVKAACQAAVFLPLFTHGGCLDGQAGCGSAAAPAGRGYTGGRTVAAEWELCCGGQWLLAATNSGFFVGCLLGSVCGGVVVDSVGRRPVVLYGTVAHAASIALASYAPSPLVYAALRFVTGALGMGLLQANFVLAMEWAPHCRRASLAGYLFTCSAAGELALVAGATALDILGLRDWRQLTLFLAVLCAASLVPAFQYCLESPKWQASHGQQDQAAAALASVAADNGAPRQVAQAIQDSGLRAPPGAKASQGDAAPVWAALLGVLRTRVVYAMGLLWFTAALVFYGISMSTRVLGGEIPLSIGVALSASSEVVSAVIAVYLLEHPSLGRRTATALLYALGGVFCAALLVTRVLSGSASFFAPVLAIHGKLFVTAAFDGIYVYTSEVFDTAVRGSALGLCSAAARVGSIVAPVFADVTPVSAAMGIFSALSLLSAAAALAVLPETLQASASGPSEGRHPWAAVARECSLHAAGTPNAPAVSSSRIGRNCADDEPALAGA